MGATAAGALPFGGVSLSNGVVRVTSRARGLDMVIESLQGRIDGLARRPAPASTFPGSGGARRWSFPARSTIRSARRAESRAHYASRSRRRSAT